MWRSASTRPGPALHYRLYLLAALTHRVDSALNAIKGGGACQLREKVLADMADTWVMVADYRKNSTVLGTNVSASVWGLHKSH